MRIIIIITLLALCSLRTAAGQGCERCDPAPTGNTHELVFRNHCADPVRLAVSIPENGTWHTFGWERLDHNEKVSFVIAGRIYYYYAYRKGGVWSGKGETTALKAPIVDGRFSYLDGEPLPHGTDVWFRRRNIDDNPVTTLTCD